MENERIFSTNLGAACSACRRFNSSFAVVAACQTQAPRRAVLGVGGYAILSNEFAVVTDNAVVSSYTVPLRTPIDGVVDAMPLKVGDLVHQGDRIATVTDDRVNTLHLVDLREHLARARAELAVVSAEMSSLETLRAALQTPCRKFQRMERRSDSGFVDGSSRSAPVVKLPPR